MPVKLSSWLKSHFDKEKLEVTLRGGFMTACGLALSMASIPQVVPPSQALMPGLMASAFSQVLPTLMFSLTGAFPSVLMLMLSVAGCSTMLLAAGSVSDGLLLGMYSVFTLLMTALYFGKHYSTTSGVANAYIAMSGLMSLSYLPLVDQGGLAAVSAMWTEKGTENELAVWRNFLIAICWSLACVAVGILLPPWQTSRRMITRLFFPSIYKQVCTVLSANVVNIKALMKSKSALKGGDVVNMTIFEPRVFHLWENLVTPMKAVAVSTDEMVFRSLLVPKWKEGLTKSPSEIDLMVLHDSASILSACGDALSTNDEAQYEKLRDVVDDKFSHRNAKDGSADDTAESKDPKDSGAYYIYKQALEVRASTLTYLRTFNHGDATETTKQKMAFSLKRAVAFIAAPLLPTIRLVEASTLVFHPKKWNFNSIMWSLELWAGFIALMAMSVYWDDYGDFRLTTADDYVGPVYSGWQLFGYAFAYRPTHEGTVKKGIQRILGTCLGGFNAWLGIIVCSWSYDDSAPINPYGLAVWLTISSMLSAYFVSLASGVAAHFGRDKDHGYVGIYMTLTQALIALEVYLGAGDKNALTLNRIVATSSGVLMAVLISFLPPHINGRDPEHSREYLSALNDAFMLLLNTFADERESSVITTDDFQKALLAPAKSKADFALFRLNDADMMRFLPFGKINEDLRPLLDEMAVTQAMIEHLLDGFAYIISNGIHVDETRTDISAILEEMKTPAEESNPAVSSDRKDPTIGWTLDIRRQIEQLSGHLDKIESSG